MQPEHKEYIASLYHVDSKSSFQHTVNILTTLDLDDLNSFPTPWVWDTWGVMMTGLSVPGDTVWQTPAHVRSHYCVIPEQSLTSDHRVPGSRWENTLKMSATSRTFYKIVRICKKSTVWGFEERLSWMFANKHPHVLAKNWKCLTSSPKLKYVIYQKPDIFLLKFKKEVCL